MPAPSLPAVNWLLGPLGPRDEDVATLARLRRALRAQAIPHFSLDYRPFLGLAGPPATFQAIEDRQSTEAFVCYGTLEFLREVRKRFALTPGVYYSQDRLKASGYLHHFPASLMLNGSGVYLPWGQLKQLPLSHLQRLVDAPEIFIKSDSGFKIFSGVVLTSENYSSALKTIEYHSSASDDTLCLLSPARPVAEEYRFVICNRTVVTGSQYMNRGQFHLSAEVSTVALDLARTIASHPWQPDVVYTCDVGLVPVPDSSSLPLPQVVELNSFSGAGLYLGDLNKIVAAVSRAAQLEFTGELSIEDPPASTLKLKF